ncbi:MAG: class I SAM-dependent RNA methyltransferase [Clostridia bacterium]
MKYIATCKLGLESLVTRQLHDLGINVEKTEDARVTFYGDYADMMRALLWLRTAERILLVIGSFPATTFDELFEQTKALDWKPFLTPHTTIHVNGKSAKSTLFSVSDCQRIVKKAIVESVKSAYRCNDIPEGGEEIIIEIGILRDEATLALDCCGAGLSRRGYRTFNVTAPLAETIGAAIVLLARFHAGISLIDPMCGSGTMPIEAAMIAQNRAPGLLRSFAAENWKFVEPALWAQAREQARDSANNEPVDILGSDIDPHCIDLCKMHAKKAGVMLNWQICPIAELSTEKHNGIFVCNPPYGERMLDKVDALELYRQMRSVFATMPDWSVNIITSVEQFERVYGRRADKRRKLTNGGMQCNLYQYFGAREK